MIVKPIPGYENLYSVSDTGCVFKNYHNCFREIKSRINGSGYSIVSLHAPFLGEKLKYVHRLMALSFLQNPENKKQINHKNGIKTDNRLENLEWATPKENIRHAVKMGLMDFKNENNPCAKLSNVDRLRALVMYHHGFTKAKISRYFKLSPSPISVLIRKYYPKYLKAKGLLQAV